MTRIYLDNAATSWPKPDSVYQAIDHYQREVGAAAGRGAYEEVTAVQRIVDQTRQQVANFINAGHQRNVVFTYSATDALCTAILGGLRDGDHVVTSVAEHNSVLRPLRQLESEGRINVTRVSCDFAGRFDVGEVLDSIRDDTRMVALTHASNVTGAIQDLKPIGQHCRENGIVFLVDAAQSIGHVPIDVEDLACDVLAASGHKGLLGPLGTGILYLSDDMSSHISPLRFGGTGSALSDDVQPNEMPEKFEAGNLNVPGLVGIQAGINFLNSDEGLKRAEDLGRLMQKLLDGILQINGITLFGPKTHLDRTPVFSLSCAHMSCVDVAAALDVTWSIQTRAGIQCAPLLHRAIGTIAGGGTVRLSIGLFNTDYEIELALGALSEIASQISI